jgi:hypothetical protein
MAVSVGVDFVLQTLEARPRKLMLHQELLAETQSQLAAV